MILANMAGIHIFATGGIGGVHRGGEDSMEISADLLSNDLNGHIALKQPTNMPMMAHNVASR